MHFKNSATLESLTVSNFVKLLAVLSVIGGAEALFAVTWDAGMHVLREPETFWSIQHVAVYTGVAFIVSAAILGSALLIKRSLEKRISTGIKLIIASAVMLIAAGAADNISHEIFGSGELVSIPHIFLEASPALGGFGSFLILTHIASPKLKKLVPISMLVTILALGSIVFNIIMVFAGTVICIIVFRLFSAGCAIL